MFNFFTRADMYPWMAEFKKGDSSFHHDFHHGQGHGIGLNESSLGGFRYPSKLDIAMAHLPALGSIILPNVGGWISGLYFAGQIRKQDPNEKSWYDELKKPTWNPPKWVFGPAWTVLYSGMGYASYLVWDECGGFTEDAVLPLALYGTQLALNWSWTPIFFGMRDFKLAFIEICVLDAAAAATTISFFQTNKTAGLLLLPYLAWLGFASTLNFWIYKNNPPKARITEIKEDSKGK